MPRQRVIAGVAAQVEVHRVGGSIMKKSTGIQDQTIGTAVAGHVPENNAFLREQSQ